MMKRKYRIGILFIALFILAGITITPALGNTTQLTTKKTQLTSFKAIQLQSEETITIEVIDCTGRIPVKTEKTITKTTYTRFQQELDSLHQTTTSTSEQLVAQIALLKKYNLIPESASATQILQHAHKRWGHQTIQPHVTPLNNTIINAMCAINFQITNGTTGVFGLNTFINLIGLNIISFHKGYSPEGINAIGLLQQTTEPGDYVGTMFGFLGYWFGTKTGTGIYTDVTAAGFTVMTAWFPLPE